MTQYDHTWLREEWERMGRPEVEILSGLNKEIWIPCADEDLFKPDRQYLIKSKPSINWDHVHPDIVAMATNEYMDTEFHKMKPEFMVNADCWDGLPFGIANSFSSFTIGTCDWRDSLVMRPVVIGETK
jgi:hypothetical protein